MGQCPDQVLSGHTRLQERTSKREKMVALVTKGIEWPGTRHTCQGQWRGPGWPCFLDKGCSPRCQFTKFPLAGKLCRQEEAGDKSRREASGPK